MVWPTRPEKCPNGHSLGDHKARTLGQEKGLLALWASPHRLLGVVQVTLSCVPTEALLSISVQEPPAVCKQKDQIFAMAISSMT